MATHEQKAEFYFFLFRCEKDKAKKAELFGLFLEEWRKMKEEQNGQKK